ncbi:MAG TPA: DUF2087 domain-containing protein [Synergistales bacterium]|nr:DUF2087 domain-containing protein [Synergistales bacterium]
MFNYNELFWKAEMEDLKRGFVEDDETGLVTCLLCGKIFEKGVIYPIGDKLFDAPRAMEEHISRDHNSVFENLLALDRKFTGLSHSQRELLSHLYNNRNDAEIARRMGIERSTVRNHRFKLKEKQRQARIFLAIMEILDSSGDMNERIAEIHKNARMVDERYDITEAEKNRILRKYFREGRMDRYPLKAKDQVVVLREAVKLFDPRKIYSEKEVNAILEGLFGDYAILRRNLVEYGFMARNPDGSGYRVIL